MTKRCSKVILFTTGGCCNQGVQGVQGGLGPQGLQGPSGGGSGVQGAQGAQGPQGSQGLQGVQGGIGLQGSQGLQGDFGPQGVQGSIGAQGPQGTQGVQGPSGLSTSNAFRAINPSPVNLPPGTLSPIVPTPVRFTTETLDQAGAYDPVTGVYTVPEAGVYDFDVHLTLGYENDDSASVTVGFELDLRINGVSVSADISQHTIPGLSVNIESLDVSFVGSLNPGDTVDVVLFGVPPADTNVLDVILAGGKFSYFEGYRVSS